MVGKRIRVMVVDDSVVARTFLTNGLSGLRGIEIVGYAINGMEAMRKIPQLAPDVVTMDVEMPGMSGIELLKALMPIYRVPVILVSSLNLRVFDALAAGAVDFVRKPDGVESREGFLAALAHKVAIAACANVKSLRPTPVVAQPLAAPPLLGGSSMEQVIIGLGASTGGTEATLEVMKRLPEDSPPMVIVQHMPVGFTKMYAERLNRLCRMEVREAVDGERLQRGMAVVAPADYQARVVRVAGRYTLACKPGDKVSGHRPSVDVMFQSMAENFRGKMVGIIMTGMGRDGADGLLSMRKAGAYTIGQDKESSVVYGMPMVAHEIGAVQIQGSAENIANLLLRHLKTL